MRRIPSTTRILLTGTPIQNNLMVRTLVTVATGAGLFLHSGLSVERNYRNCGPSSITRARVSCWAPSTSLVASLNSPSNMPHTSAPRPRRSSSYVFPCPFTSNAAIGLVSRRLTSLAWILATSHTSCRSSCVISWRPISCAARRRTCSTPTAALPRPRVASRRLLNLPRRKGRSKRSPLG